MFSAPYGSDLSPSSFFDVEHFHISMPVAESRLEGMRSGRRNRVERRPSSLSAARRPERRQLSLDTSTYWRSW